MQQSPATSAGRLAFVDLALAPRPKIRSLKGLLASQPPDLEFPRVFYAEKTLPANKFIDAILPASVREGKKPAVSGKITAVYHLRDYTSAVPTPSIRVEYPY
jgi:hypothetical protein